MKKLIAVAGIALIAASGAAFAAQPYMGAPAGHRVTAEDRQIAATYAPGDLFATTHGDNHGRTTVRTLKVLPNGTPKVIDVDYSNSN